MPAKAVAWIMLGDFAQVHAGKLFVSGAGVSVAGSPTQLGVAVEMLLPWEWRSSRRTLKLDLVDEDQQPVIIPTAITGIPGEAFSLQGHFMAIQAQGVPNGSQITSCFAFNLVGLPLERGRTFTFRLFLEGEEEPTATKTFATMPLG